MSSFLYYDFTFRKVNVSCVNYVLLLYCFIDRYPSVNEIQNYQEESEKLCRNSVRCYLQCYQLFRHLDHGKVD